MTGRGFGFESKPGSDEWYTPPGLFDSMGVRFDLDPCGVPNTPAAAHCASMYVHPHQDGRNACWPTWTASCSCAVACASCQARDSP